MTIVTKPLYENYSQLFIHVNPETYSFPQSLSIKCLLPSKHPDRVSPQLFPLFSLVPHALRSLF